MDTAFGTDLYMLLAGPAEDTVFSPASVAAALRMALCGARGETAAELAAALRLIVPPEGGSDGPADAAAAGLRSLAVLVHEAIGGDAVTFRVANTAWVQSGLPVRPEFTARLDGAASAAIADVDFAHTPDAACRQINQVIAKQTEDKITGLLTRESVTAQTRLVLANAVYLKAPWAEPFPEKDTRDAPFYPQGRDGPSQSVSMMRGTATRHYRRGDGYQAVLLPYQHDRLAMAVVLPDGPLEDLRPRLAAAGLRGLLAGTAKHRVTLSMPRFRVETQLDLIPALKRLGVTHAFSSTADFSGITEAERLLIGAAAHKAYIDVDENGTEAAAATAVLFYAAALLRPPPPVTMTVDRPFLFAVVDTAAGTPLFLGQVTCPG